MSSPSYTQDRGLVVSQVNNPSLSLDWSYLGDEFVIPQTAPQTRRSSFQFEYDNPIVRSFSLELSQVDLLDLLLFQEFDVDEVALFDSAYCSVDDLNLLDVDEPVDFTPQFPLVGVELNPGPVNTPALLMCYTIFCIFQLIVYSIWYRIYSYFNLNHLWLYIVGVSWNLYILRFYVLLFTYDVPENPFIFDDVDEAIDVSYVPPAERLVGIEPNPGPVPEPIQCIICGVWFTNSHICSMRRRCSCISICEHNTDVATLFGGSLDTLVPKVPSRLDTEETLYSGSNELKRKPRVVKRKFRKPIAQMFSVTHTVDPKLSETLEKLCSSLENVSMNFENLKTGEIAKSFLSGFAEEVAIPAVEILAGTYVVCSFVNTPSKKTAAALTVYLTYLVYTKGYKLMNWPEVLTEMCMKYKDERAMSQMDASDLTSLASFLGLIVHAYLVGDAPAESFIKKLTKFSSSLQLSTGGFEFTMKYIVNIVEKIVNYIRVEYMDLSGITLFKNTDSDVQDVLDDCNRIHNLYRNGQFKINVENSQALISLSHRMRDLISKYGNMRDRSGTKTQLMMYYSELEALKNKFVQSNIPLMGIKFTPIFIVLEGNSQIGKSHMMYPFCSELGIRCLPRLEAERFMKNHNAFIYTRNHETVYWDGYMGQFFCIVDDLGQVVSESGDKDSEWMNIIRMVSSFPYLLHMADLMSKGNTFFSSKFVVATTNLYSYNIESLSYPKAITERMHLRAHVVPAERFRTRESALTMDKRLFALDKSKTNGIVDFSVYEFHLRDKNGEYTGEVLDYEQFCSRCEDLYNKHNGNHEEYTLAIEDIKKRAFEKKYGPIAQMDFEEFYDSEEESPEDSLVKWISKLDKDEKKKLFATVLMRNPTLTEDDYGECFQEIIRVLDKEIHLALKCDCEGVCQMIKSKPLQVTNTNYSLFSNLVVTLNGVSQNLRDSISEITEKYSPFTSKVAKLLGAVAAIGSIMTIPTLVSYFSKEPVESQSSVRNKPRDKRDKTKLRRKVMSAKSKIATVAHAQGVIINDDSMYNISNKIVRRNCYELHLPGGTRLAGVVTFLCDRIMIIPLHYVLNIASAIDNDPLYGTKNVTLKKCMSDVKFSFPVACLLNFTTTDELENNDLCLIEVKEYNLPCHMSILKYFVDERTVSKNRDLYGTLIKPRVGGVESYFSPYEIITNKEVYNTTIDEVYNIVRAYQYNVPNRVGDCGSIFFLFDATTGSQKILGFHDSGITDQGIGYASSVFQEDMIEALKNYQNVMIKEPEVDAISQGDFTPVPGKFLPLYDIPKSVKTSSTTKIVPSPLHGMWKESTTKPAHLKPFKNGEVKIDPYSIGLSKYDPKDVFVDPVTLEIVRQSLLSDMQFACDFPLDKRIYTKEEAFAGIDGTNFGSVPRSTSEGYPGVLDLDPRNPGKTKYFGKDGKFDFSSRECAELFVEMDKIVSQCKNNIVPQIVFVDYLKDERRPIAKVDQGKTRIISCSPIAFTGLVRQYFGAFIKWLNDNKIKNGSAVGVNPYSSEWQMIVNKLLQIGSDIGAGDYSAFDGSQIPQIQKTFLVSANEWYGDSFENQTVRKVLFECIINSIHIHENHLYEWIGSEPSGHPLTTLLNNWYNHMLFRLSWVVAHDRDPYSVLNFRKNVFLITLGDDNLFSVSPNKREQFNELVISKIMPEFGVEYTNEKKTESVIKYRNINEVSFLKRGFRYEPLVGRYVAPLDLDVVLEMSYWTKETHQRNTIFVDTANNSLLELSLHGKEVYDFWSKKINDCAISKGIKLECLPFHLALNKCCNLDLEF